jgi:hypothetical protein
VRRPKIGLGAVQEAGLGAADSGQATAARGRAGEAGSRWRKETRGGWDGEGVAATQWERRRPGRRGEGRRPEIPACS